jgi:hypothetical protein
MENINGTIQVMELSMQDVRNIKHNLDGRTKGNFMENYRWNEDTKLYIKDVLESGTWNGKEIAVCELHEEWELGYAVIMDGKVEYLIGIYEPHGCSLNIKRGLLTTWGHENIIKLWLEDGEIEDEYTR